MLKVRNAEFGMRNSMDLGWRLEVRGKKYKYVRGGSSGVEAQGKELLFCLKP
jgi:hypothetical protein